ncbi:hypothetical protein [Fluviispira sanaruensis]|uniref:Uncharacterized protein n=1 Tax=Fluviispira sanaruensis TaxID=2493639 RepID=A0A4V0P2U4_FLUSA|nr:hypothetical protein [Fluviispira sanaruensis]BBH54437.1 hypothetical protein JCM31447_29020 [Fluviispira sanaruensis]
MNYENLQNSELIKNEKVSVADKSIRIIRKKLRSGDKYTKMQESLALALNEVASSPYVAKRWVKLCLSYVEFVSPVESAKEPGRLMILLSQFPYGLSRNDLLAAFYEGYANSSPQRKESLRVCLEKIIQRARIIFFKYDLTIIYCKINKKYLISPLFKKHNK